MRVVLIALAGVAVVVGAMVAGRLQADRWLQGLLLAAVVVLCAFEVARSVGALTADRHRAERNAARAARQISEAETHYIDVLWRILHYSESRCKYTQGHSERVGTLSEAIARQLGCEEEFCLQMHQAGRLHDIGMLAVSERILGDRGTLSPGGRQSVQRHPEVGFEILQPLQSLRDILPAIRHHHERTNGTGYPDRLRGEDIPLGGRIIAVADAYDAMTHDRAHRAAIAPLAAYSELDRCCPSGFDSACVEALAAALDLSALQDAFDCA